MTFLRLVPGSSHFGAADGLEVWDLPSAATICRNLIEAYHVLCYFTHFPVDEDMKGFRTLLWEYHEEFERHEMLCAGVKGSNHLPAIAQELQQRRCRLELSPVFRRLNGKLQKDLLRGKYFKLESAIDLSRQAGICEDYYRSQYKYCCAYAHSAPFSFSQSRDFRRRTEEAKQLFTTLVQCATGYVALALRDFVGQFPEQKGELGDEAIGLILRWEGILSSWDSHSVNP